MKILIDEAIELLQQGLVIAIPTDTVYGLAASKSDPEASAKIFELKKRPSSNPLVLFLKSSSDLDLFVTLPPKGQDLVDAFWPGPLTLVLPKKESVSTLAIRIPNHPLILSLLEKTGPLFVTSANISGSPPLKTVSEIEHCFGKEFPILDGALPTHAIASTILSYKNGCWQIDRLGPLSPEAFAPILGYSPLSLT